MELFSNKKIVLIGVSCLSVFFVLHNLTVSPPVWVDEGVFTEVARNLAFHNTIGLQTAPGVFHKLDSFVLSVSYPVIFPVALSLKIFGVGIVQARLPMILYMLGLILLFYLFTNKRYGFYIGILSTLSLISFAPFYGNGRSVIGEVPGLFFLVLGLYFLSYLEDAKFNDKKFALISGLALGLSSSTKVIYLTFLSLSLFVASILWFKKIENKKIFAYILSGYLLPIILWIYIHFRDAASLKDIIKSYFYFAGAHGSSLSTFQIIIANLLRFFTESTPMLFSALLGVVLFSLIIKFLKDRFNSISITEVTLVLFVLLNILGYLKGTGWYRYFFPAHVLLYLIFPAAILQISNLIENNLFKRLFFLFPIMLILFQFYYFAFLSVTPFVNTSTRNIELSRTLSAVSSDKKILFDNTIEAIVFYKGLNYSQYLSMEDFLIAGDKDSIITNKYDFILTDTSSLGNVLLSCYSEKPVSRYFLLERKNNCN